jgi:dynein heavy chain
MVRLWAHEIFRVFGDRLIDDEDRLWLLNNVRDLVKKIYGVNFDNVFGYLDSDKDGKVETLDEIRKLLFGYLLTNLGQTPHYEEMVDFDQLQR